MHVHYGFSANERTYLNEKEFFSISVYGDGRGVKKIMGEILSPGKQPQRVRARSLVCCRAVQEPGMKVPQLPNYLA